MGHAIEKQLALLTAAKPYWSQNKSLLIVQKGFHFNVVICSCSEMRPHFLSTDQLHELTQLMNTIGRRMMNDIDSPVTGGRLTK